MSVMRALHVRVYSAKGKVLVRGARELPRDFALYDLELRSMADALSRGETRSLDEIAAIVGRLRDSREPVEAEALRAVLRSGVRSSARKPRARRALVPLLVRELGLRHQPRYDLLGEEPASRLRFDSLQAFLIAADIYLGSARRDGGRRRAEASAASAGSASPPCTSVGATTAGDAWQFGKWALGAAKKLGPILIGATTGLDAIHGPILAATVEVTAASPELQATHYGPAGHAPDAGNALEFKVRVEMLADLGAWVINCGALAGMKFPKKGGIPGVPIVWETVDAQLNAHGSTSLSPPDGKTGPDGVATLVFKPKDESSLPLEIADSERGVVNGLALYQTAFGNYPVGLPVQWLDPKYAGMVWEVFFHKPRRGYRFATEKLENSYGCNASGCYTDSWQFKAEVCGEQAYGVPWRGEVTHYHFGTNQGPETSFTERMDWTFPSPTQHSPEARAATTAFLFVDDAGLFRVEYLHASPDGPTSRVAQVRIEENLDCPPV